MNIGNNRVLQLDEFLLRCIFRADIFCSGVFRCVCVCLGVLGADIFFWQGE